MPQLRDVVLLVEDEDSVRRALTRTLVCADLKVVGASNGELALQELRRLAGSLGLLITDINMPGMNGFELARACWTILPAVPILFITGVGTRATAAQADRLGAELLLKPFSPDHFLDIVTRLIAQDPVADHSLA
jgi:DNA-binding NtrC family response regulator